MLFRGGEMNGKMKKGCFTEWIFGIAVKIIIKIMMINV